MSEKCGETCKFESWLSIRLAATVWTVKMPCWVCPSKSSDVSLCLKDRGWLIGCPNIPGLKSLIFVHPLAHLECTCEERLVNETRWIHLKHFVMSSELILLIIINRSVMDIYKRECASTF